MTGTQIAKELGVSPSAVTKATKDIVNLGIVRKEALPVASNIKLYTLAVSICDEKEFTAIKDRVSPVLVDIISNQVLGNEKLALLFVDKTMSYLKSIDEKKRGSVLELFLKDTLNKREKNGED